MKEEARAEEILQDAFTKIWKNIKSYDPAKGRPFAWMLNLTQNAVMDVVRTSEYRTSASVHTRDKHVFRTGSDEMRQGQMHIGVESVLERMLVEHRERIDMAYYRATRNRRSPYGRACRWGP